MKVSDLPGRRWALPLLGLALLASAGCHGTTEYAPLATQKIYVADRFYDMALLGPKHAIVVGYDGKILDTSDSGVTWNQVDSGTANALYNIEFANENVGWIVGQEAEILKTTDGGKSWESQGGNVYMSEECRESGGEEDDCAKAPLFALSVVDENEVFAIGDRSTVAHTTDGGRTWTATTLHSAAEAAMDPNMALAFEDPVLYDVQFLDKDTGFVVGEFGKIFKTVDGGKTWKEKEQSLVGGDYFDVMELPTFFDIQFLSDKVGFAVGLEARIARTTDGGETWQWVPHDATEYRAPFYASSISPNGNVWIVGASGQVVTGTTTASEFHRGTFGSQVTNWIRQVRFYDDNTGWVVGGFGFIMNTDDGGKTWFRRIG